MSVLGRRDCQQETCGEAQGPTALLARVDTRPGENHEGFPKIYEPDDEDVGGT